MTVLAAVRRGTPGAHLMDAPFLALRSLLPLLFSVTAKRARQLLLAVNIFVCVMAGLVTLLAIAWRGDNSIDPSFD